MPIHILKSPDVVSPRGVLVVAPGDTEFLLYTFNGAMWIPGVQCHDDDMGGSVRDFMHVRLSYIEGHQHKERLEMFKYALEESRLQPRGSLMFERALKGSETIVRLTIKHLPRTNTRHITLPRAA